MEKLMRLRTEWRDALLAHTPEDSVLYKLMKSGIEITGCINMPKEIAMFCDEAGMRAILKAATQHCPQAVREIETEIHRSRNSKS
jgi:heterodisulfide reductase subunit A-like polyferredoxin